MIVLLDGNERMMLVIKCEWFIMPVITYAIDDVYSEEQVFLRQITRIKYFQGGPYVYLYYLS